MTSNIQEILISKITDPGNPMRSSLDDDAIKDLAESIKKEGLINPITVRAVHGCSMGELPECQRNSIPAVECKKMRYEVVAGHRRFLACRFVGLAEISCVVRDLDNAQALEVMAHENLHRLDVDPVDEAIFIGRMINELHYKIKDVAEKLGRSIQWVEDRLGILDYSDYLIGLVKEGKLKLGVAKNLAEIKDDFYQKMYADQAVQYGMSILQADYLRRQYNMGILIPVEKFAENVETINSNISARVHAVCAKCGKLAEDPNLHNVFIHIECPA